MQYSRLAGKLLSYCALLHRSADLLQHFKGAPKCSDNPVLLCQNRPFGTLLKQNLQTPAPFCAEHLVVTQEVDSHLNAC